MDRRNKKEESNNGYLWALGGALAGLIGGFFVAKSIEGSKTE